MSSVQVALRAIRTQFRSGRISIVAMAASNSGVSLPTLYKDAVASLKKFDDGVISTRDSCFAETLSGLVGKFKECLKLIEAHSVFSSNEEVEDVHTAHLKYVLVPFQLAMTYQKVMDMDKRGEALKASKALFKSFLRNCTNLGLIGDKEVDMYLREGLPSTEDLRAEKLERTKARKDLEKKLEAINNRRSISAKRESDVGSSQQESDVYDDEDEYERVHSIVLIELAIKTALDELSMLDREIEILSHMAAIKQFGKDVVEASLPPPKPGWEGVMTPEGPLKTFVIDKKLQIKKATFKPHWNQPTISVEEAGEIEYALALEQETAQKASQAKAEAQKLSESDEENDDASLKKARDWDQFKDDHPFGSGNTGSKGYTY